MDKEKINQYFNKMKQRFHNLGDRITHYFKFFYIILSYSMVFWFLIFIIISFITGIFLPTRDYNFIISGAINGTILSATLALLTFTYALVLDYPKRAYIINVGEFFLKATLNFMLGIIFIGLFALVLNKADTMPPLPEFINNFMLSLTLFILFFIGIIALVMSVYFFSIGIASLLKKIL
jgi:hypothetical protein